MIRKQSADTNFFVGHMVFPSTDLRKQIKDETVRIVSTVVTARLSVLSVPPYTTFQKANSVQSDSAQIKGYLHF